MVDLVDEARLSAQDWYAGSGGSTAVDMQEYEEREEIEELEEAFELLRCIG